MSIVINNFITKFRKGSESFLCVRFAITFSLISAFTLLFSFSQDTVKYTSSTLVNVDYHHGQLAPAVGVHNIQILRANREYPDSVGGYGWTYNHGPNMAYWNERFYIQYLSNPVSEHVPPGMVFLVNSKDGYNWSMPEVLFPTYRIPDGTTKENIEGVAKDLDAVLHQRMGFYVASNNTFLTLAYYGICLNAKDHPNDGKGIGRVVREIEKDGSFGPIYFIRYNKGWNEKNTNYPFYKSSRKEAFVDACDELLSNPLMMQQWVEEADRDDPLIPLKKQYKAFCFYHLPDGRVVGLWKYALTSISDDNGKTWEYNPLRAPGFVNKNAKIWGQKTSDGNYVTVYNPSEFRWPLALSVSEDGLEYTNLLLVHGEITTMRYGGNYKSYGPQYVRGILEGNGFPSDGDLWVTYSMNKEDIWVSRIPVPISDKVLEDVDEDFSKVKELSDLQTWNIYSPRWAPVSIKEDQRKTFLSLTDFDPADFAKAERVVPSAQKMTAKFGIVPNQNDYGTLQIEFQNSKGNGAIRIMFEPDGTIRIKDGYRDTKVTEYKAGESYKIQVDLEVKTRFYTITINDSIKKSRMFYAPVHSIDRIVFRTGKIRRFPDADSPYEQVFDVDNAGDKDKKAEFLIEYLKIE